MFDIQHLFEARTGGYRTYRIPGIAATDHGTVLVTAEARRGSGGDWDANDIIMRRSVDVGESWSEARRIVCQENYGEGPVSNFVMIPDGNTVHALFCHNYARIFRLYSEDEGLSWSEPQEITEAAVAFRVEYEWRVIATGPGHGIRTDTSRIIVPLWMSTGGSTKFGEGKLGHRPSVVSLIYSDDKGETWCAGEIVLRHGEHGLVNPSETVSVQLSDGRVLFNIRSESSRRRRIVSVSADGTKDWSGPRFDEALLEPVCMASILRLREISEDGRPMIIFANPDNLENELIMPGGNLAHDRKRLTVKMSPDDCGSWPVSRVLEPGPSGYSDLAQHPNGTIFCVHEDQIIERMCDDRYISVRRFDIEWLIGDD